MEPVLLIGGSLAGPPSVLTSEYHYCWEWQLRASPPALWPLVSDTKRSSRDTGVPVVEIRPLGSSQLANERRLLRRYRFGLPIEWTEEPFEWIRRERVRAERFTAIMKGFENEPIELWAVAPRLTRPGRNLRRNSTG